MKKNQDGYILIYVLVIILVMGAVTAGVMSASIRNLHAQKVYGQQMQELYEAEGIAEQLVAEIGAQSGTLLFTEMGPDDLPVTDEEGHIVYNSINITSYSNEQTLKLDRNVLIATANALASKIEELKDAEMTIELVEDETISVPDGSTRRIATIGARFPDPLSVSKDYYCTLPFHIVVHADDTKIEMELAVAFKLSVLNRQDEDKGEFWVDGGTGSVNGWSYTSYEIGTGVSE